MQQIPAADAEAAFNPLLSSNRQRHKSVKSDPPTCRLKGRQQLLLARLQQALQVR